MLKGEPNVRESLDTLVEKIKNTKIYQNYVRDSEAVGRQPGLQEQIDEYRRKNFMIQQNYEGDELFRQLEHFVEEYRDFRTQPLVDNFLDSELAFIRLKQEIDSYLLKELSFPGPE